MVVCPAFTPQTVSAVVMKRGGRLTDPDGARLCCADEP